MNKLEGKIAVITGGNSGIGLATAKRYVEEGAHVYITGRRQKQLDLAIESLGKNATAVQGDVTINADLDRLYEQIRREQGRVDIVFANAGIGVFIPLEEVSESSFDLMFNVNVRGLFFTVQKAIPLMPDGSSIILCGASTATMGFAGLSVYIASKAALRGFARCWSVELQHRRIRTNVLTPGPTETPLYGKGLREDQVEPFKTLAALQTLTGVLADPDEIAKAAVFLASSDGAFIIGADIPVDGGHAQV
ncbi:SDR family oxidoreductase [Terriglobus saanensis]|uniref:Short-chain dehydrogenase/reductase SDR n=1 Tax=Terriglobus saanensis (strain ATCC BAA-1853 / DSM 23119 / SP1PR4) TaxID=401053 RepID=E8V567_TERSS|nr:SDR family oxidoreductase [Terriglobus saanensis]ADV83754.1 short-chain dehydrogenase/reductase SDR [Terriglobus saanensis SP1PR4]